MSNSSIVKLGSQAASFRRMDGIVSEKNGLVTIEHKVNGMVKTKTASFPANLLAAYQTGTPGFVVAPSSEPITTFVGKVSSKDGKLSVSTENGTVIINQIAGVAIAMDEVEADSVEARRAERAAKVKVKLPRAAKEATSSKGGKLKKKKSSREEAAPVKKSTTKSVARTEAVAKKKKKSA